MKNKIIRNLIRNMKNNGDGKRRTCRHPETRLQYRHPPAEGIPQRREIWQTCKAPRIREMLSVWE